MNFKDKGLTVGELTMAIGSLIIISLIWTSFSSKQNNDEQNSKVTSPIYPSLITNLITKAASRNS